MNADEIGAAVGDVPGSGELSMTFRGVPISEELLFFARRLRTRLSPDPRAGIQLEVAPSPVDAGAVDIVSRPSIPALLSA